MTSDTWRLIPLCEASGKEQMAIDNWLLDQHVKGLQPSCLRFYTWRSPTLSLGYHQHQFPAHWSTLHYKGQPIDLVRRPTGGRAVLHQGDLTYALITSGLTGSRREIYQQLCQFLIEGWQDLGIVLSFGDAGRGYIKNPNCFGTATAADLVMQTGYKLIGSAQVYREGCVLQHGSMRLQPDSTLFKAVFDEDISTDNLTQQLLDNLLVNNSFQDITAALTAAASRTLNARFNRSELTTEESQSAMKSLIKTRRKALQLQSEKS